MSHLVSILVAGLVVAVALSGPAQSDTYEIDPQHTDVRFSWNHLGLSRQSGRFSDVSGTLDFDPAEPEAAYAEISIKLATLTTGVAPLDQALTGTADFFNIPSHPTATFRTTSVRRTGGKTAKMIGDLSMNGISRPVTLEVTWNFSGDHPMAQINPAYTGLYVAGFSATTQLLRSDWGITRTIPYVSDEIQISIETEMRRKGGTGAEAGAGVTSDAPGSPYLQ